MGLRASGWAGTLSPRFGPSFLTDEAGAGALAQNRPEEQAREGRAGPAGGSLGGKVVPPCGCWRDCNVPCILGEQAACFMHLFPSALVVWETERHTYMFESDLI